MVIEIHNPSHSIGDYVPGYRSKNLRSGDVAESLALVMLQSFALVAPIPRTEDVGTDAVVTLLRDYDGKRVIAEDSFFLQIKSESVGEVTYEDDQVKWLFDLDLPIFYASIDRKSCAIRLFCAHELSEAFIMNHERKKVVIDFSSKDNFIDLMSPTDERVKIGPPVMEWSLNDCADPEFANQFYRLIKDHVRIAKTNLKTRNFGRVTYLGWRTNEPLVEGLIKTSQSRPASEHLNRLYEEMMPFFTDWAIATMLDKRGDQLHEIEKLLKTVNKVLDASKKL